MIRTLIWKEWHEHRRKYALYWLVLNAPILLVALAVGIVPGARTPFTELSDGTILKYLPMALAEPWLISSLFLIATDWLALATFSPEIEDRTLLFVSEQPVSRQWYVTVKLLIGGLQTVLAVCFATLFATVAAYGIMLASGKITAAGSVGAFHAMLAASARAAVWSSLISLTVFSGSALVAALAPRRWLAAAGSIALVALRFAFGGDLFDFAPSVGDGDPISFNMGFSTGSSQWVSLSRPLHFAEVTSYASWRLMPLLVAVLLTVVFAVAMAQVYGRKEVQ